MYCLDQIAFAAIYSELKLKNKLECLLTCKAATYAWFTESE
jgi:hypothetical protein